MMTTVRIGRRLLRMVARTDMGNAGAGRPVSD
jgi:hypothetical protein